MKSHTCEFEPGDLLRQICLPLVPLLLFAVVMHLGARLELLPVPRPTLDTERTILIHQAEAARTAQTAEIILLGDSSCLMNISARRLQDHLQQPVLNLGTFSFLDLQAQALLLREHTRANPGRLRTIVLLLHPDSLRRSAPEAYYISALTNFLAGRDHFDSDNAAGQFNAALGVETFKGRLLARVLPVPLNGAYGLRYGFNRDLESHLVRERGSAIDPDSKPATGSAEYRLAPSIERASRAFRSSVPPGFRLIVGITPVPERFAGPRYPALHRTMLEQWSAWLKADVALTNLPPTLPDESFIRTTHLKEQVIPRYTDLLAEELRPVAR